MRIFLLLLLIITSQVCLALPVVEKKESAPCVIVIFGATGDLTARKLLPGIYNLAHEGNLLENSAVVGFARRKYTHETFRSEMHQAVEKFSRTKMDNVFWNTFEKKLFYNQSAFDEEQGYEDLKKLLLKIDQDSGVQAQRIYYLATQPSHFSLIIEKLNAHQLIQNSKVVIEKPFGYDLESAVDLQKNISKYLDESQIYLMDHYLGKEGVQNLLSFRFENKLLEPFWNHQHIDHVQITLSEEMGIGTRAHFWEETGYLRDVFQNHLMQLLALLAMEPPRDQKIESIQTEKIKVLHAVRPFPVEEIDKYIVRGQYGPGKLHGLEVLGYNQESGVPKTSPVETFLTAKLFIDNPRWQGVPFYVRGGKRLPVQTTEIAIVFKKDPSKEQAPKTLFIRIQPNAGIFLETESKTSAENRVQQVLLASFQKTFQDAYEKLIYDCIRSDKSLFVKTEEQLAAWRLFTPVIKHWKAHPPETFPNYEAGTWGPSSVDPLLKQNGHQWRLLENSK